MTSIVRFSSQSAVNNPVLPLEVGVLNAQAAALAADDPVDAFLTSSAITSVNPEVRPHPHFD